MLSRVADALFWLNTYIERSENIARFIHVNMHLILDLYFERDARHWEPLIIVTGDEDAFNAKYDEVNEANVIHFLTFDTTNPNSVISCISAARENAKSIREVISSEMWEQINHLYMLVKENSRKRKIENLHGFFKQIILESNLFTGLSDATMLHSEGLFYGHLGRMLERTDKTTRMIDVKGFMLLPSAETSDSPYDILQWSALLKSLSAFELYRKTNRSITSQKTIQFLLFNEAFPRSVIHCIKRSHEILNKLQEFLVDTRVVNESLENLCLWLEKLNAHEVLQIGLHQFIDEVQLQLIQIINDINKSFFCLDFAVEAEKIASSVAQTANGCS